MNEPTRDEKPRYGIGAVARLTGITDHTIRVWERRYEAVVAERGANGRRIYRPADVEKLGLLKQLTDNGISISHIANESTDQLKARAASLSSLYNPPSEERVAIAVLGESLTAQLKSARDELTPLELTVVETNRERFIAALMDVNPDVIAIENPTLSRESVEDLKRLLKLSGARGGIVVYNFGASRDLEYARQAGVVAARAPLDIEQLMAAIVRAASSRPPAGRASRSKPPAESGEWQLAGPAAPHRFTQQQLATLAATTSTIDCECPQHLAQLVSNLSAFEVYSANCANRDDDDAALHRYLHHTTARARALIEEALEKVAIAEDLSY